MSPNVGNFVHDLVEMAKAMETLPQVQEELDWAKRKIDELAQTVQDRELALIARNKDIDDLKAKIRTTEAERDDAEIRFLELDEKAHKVLAHVAAVQAGALAVQELLTPPKPEPVKEPEPHPFNDPQGGGMSQPVGQEPQAQGQSEQVPIATDTGTQSHDAPIPNVSTAGSVNTTSPSGQSDAAPTVQPSATPTDAGSSPATTSDVGTIGEGSGDDKPVGPYTGERYYDFPHWVSREDWRAGGGTDADYDWRPGHDFYPPRS